MKTLYSLLIVPVLFVLSLTGSVSAQGVQDFNFSRFDAEYVISKDDEGRSTMRVTETLIAEFPDFKQNKGIVRDIPRRYGGRSLSFELLSLGRNGQPEPIYEQTTVGEFVSVSTGTEDYLTGTQEFTIVYQLRDVIRDFGDFQELFWDINGTGWRQSFGEVRATVVLDESVHGAFSGKATCYQGVVNSREACDYQTDENSATFNATRILRGGENLSAVMEFQPGTFEPYQEGFAGVFWAIIAGSSMFLSVAGAVLAVRLKLRTRDFPGRGIVVRQYLVPKNVSVMLAGMVDKRPKIVQKAFTAQIMELAVQKKIKIIDTGQRSVPLIGKKTYELEIANTTDISNEGQELLTLLFGLDYVVGQRYNIPKTSSTIGIKMQAFQKMLKERVIQLGYRTKTTGKWIPGVMVAGGVVLAIATLILLEEAGGVDFASDWRPYALVVAVPSFLTVIVVLFSNLDPLTQKGRELFDYVRGMKEYISLAETERLRFAQSPDGAQRTKINTDDTGEVIKLYEELLPYAVLFSQEKQWFEQLGKYYEERNETPYWYAGTGAFNSSSFASAMSGISSAAASSSSSGFSGGGGSGGGGGGGGGGGR
ncbi:DUF2207 domain-containing protein [soil metagenome]